MSYLANSANFQRYFSISRALLDDLPSFGGNFLTTGQTTHNDYFVTGGCGFGIGLAAGDFCCGATDAGVTRAETTGEAWDEAEAAPGSAAELRISRRKSRGCPDLGLIDCKDCKAAAASVPDIAAWFSSETAWTSSARLTGTERGHPHPNAPNHGGLPPR